MNIDKILKEFADKFGKTEQEKQDIKKANKITIDYADGVLDLLYDDPETDSLYFCYHGGSNGCIFGDEDYRFIWDNIISKDAQFASWLNTHKLSETDMMVVCIDMYDHKTVDIHCSFSFYGTLS